MGIDGSVGFGDRSKGPGSEQIAKVVAGLPDRIRDMPKKEQDELYLMFYCSFVLNRESNAREAEKNRLQLFSLQQAWGMPEARVASLRERCDKQLQTVNEYLDAYCPIVM